MLDAVICNLLVIDFSSNMSCQQFVYPIPNRKYKTSELLLINILKLESFFVIEPHHEVCASFKISILYYSETR